MLKAFYQIDLFGKPVLFNYKGNSKSKSKVGAIFTIVLFGFIVWVTVYFGKQLLDTSNPKAGSYESFNENPSATYLNSDNFAFGIAMTNAFTFANYINESIYTISAYTYKTTRVPQADGSVQIQYDFIPLELEKCRSDHFGELSESFSYVGLDQLYCLKKEQVNLDNNSPVLQGTFESPIFQNVVFEFHACDPNVTSTCGTQDEIDALLEAGLLSMSFSNIAIDLTDNKKPIKKFRDGWYTTVGTTYSKEVDLYLDQLEINTDQGWLTSDFQKSNYIKYGQIKELFSLSKKSAYATFIIRLSNVKTHYNRSYTKIQDIIAQINGTVVVTFTILFIVLAPYVRLKFYEALINDIFDIKTSKRKQQGNNTPRKRAKQTRKNSKNDESKTKPTLTLQKYMVEDLEQQATPSIPHSGPIMMDKIEEPDNINLIRKMPSIEEEAPPTLDNLNEIQSKPSLQMRKPSASMVDSLNNYAKTSSMRDTINNDTRMRKFSHSNRMSRSPIHYSGFHNENRFNNDSRRGTSELATPIISPKSSLQDSVLTPRKPSFLKPNFKILDYEGHQQDLFEDILKNIDHKKKRDGRNLGKALENSQLRSEEKEKNDSQDEKLKSPKEIVSMISSDDDIEKEKPQDEVKETKKPQSRAKYNLQRLDLITAKNVDEINLSFWEYLRSFCTRSDVIKQKINLLNEGIDRINERLDIFNIFRKLREFDKLKVLLLENEQFVLFDSLPRPELILKEIEKESELTPDRSRSKITDPQFVQERIKKDLILLSYENLKRKSSSTMLDKKLLEIYDDFLSMKTASQNML